MVSVPVLPNVERNLCTDFLPSVCALLIKEIIEKHEDGRKRDRVVFFWLVHLPGVEVYPPDLPNGFKACFNMVEQGGSHFLSVFN